MEGKIIVTVVGKDAVGIIAKICTYLANNRVNVSDISQTITGGLFNMMMVVELPADDTKPFDELQRELAQVGEEIGVEVRCQRSEIFEMMHRV
ncbi:MAG: ACT domain-containing protein [Lachnospiraceae bacterium]|nr:ACT domain-containing protein [Lachnospiraceae bacterium]